jgi:hypothetical protein
MRRPTASGPGRDDDTKNDPKGSKPIIISDGGFTDTIEVRVVRQELTLEMDIDAYNESHARLLLGTQYGVPVELITLSTVVPGSVRFTVTIEVPTSTAGEAAAETLVTDLLSRASAVEAGLSTAFNVTVNATAPQAMNKTKVIEVQCRRGFWWALVWSPMKPCRVTAVRILQEQVSRSSKYSHIVQVE